MPPRGRKCKVSLGVIALGDGGGGGLDYFKLTNIDVILATVVDVSLLISMQLLLIMLQ